MDWEIGEWIKKKKMELKDTTEINNYYDKNRLDSYTKEELLNVIYHLVEQCCCDWDGNCDTEALTYYAWAFALLGDVGLVDIESAIYRRAIGKLRGKYYSRGDRGD